VADVQFVINQALGGMQAASDLNADGVVDVVDVEIVVNSALGLNCSAADAVSTQSADQARRRRR
jgi:hypothetical protein